MFIVYSPEGQNKVSSVSQLPIQRVNSVHRVNQVSASDLASFNPEHETANNGGKRTAAQPKAASIYEKNQQGDRRRVASAEQLMSNPVIVVGPLSSLQYAWGLMQQEHIKHLPVIEDGAIIGMCAHDDLLRRLYFNADNVLQGDLESPVKEVMQTTVISTSLNTDVRHVAQALTEYDIDVLLVMASNQDIKGIITEKDLISRLAKEPPLEVYI